ncbi:unnamed protein product [Absidia cylindrospora]
MASVIRGRHHQLFGTQRILWEKSNDNSGPGRQYMFTIQMPLIQHPPSLDYGRLRYKCRYKLTAMLDERRKTGGTNNDLVPLLTAHQTIHYRPWVATRILKVPMVRHSRWLVVQMINSDYVAGEACQVQVNLSPSALAMCVKSSLVGMQVVMELVQIATLPCQLEDERIPPSETVYCRSAPVLVPLPPGASFLDFSSGRRTSVSSSAPGLLQACLQTSTPLSLVIPPATPPSYSFGRVLSIHYELALRVSGKKKKRAASLWTSAFSFSDDDEIRIPLVVGTLGHGIRVPDDIRNYTHFSGVFGDTRAPQPQHPSSSSTSHSLTRVDTTTSASSLSTLTLSPRLSRPITRPPLTSSASSENGSLLEGDDRTSTTTAAATLLDQQGPSTSVPVPKFLHTIEYENSLPTYHPSTLPPYTPPSSTRPCILV